MGHAYMLSALSRQGCFSTTLADNGRPEVQGAQNLLGLFLNALPFRLAPAGRTWREFATELERDEAERKPHRSYPFAKVLQANRTLQVDSIFTYNNFHVTEELQRDETIQITASDAFEQTNFKIATLVGGSPQRGLIVTLEVMVDLSERQIDVLLQEFAFALELLTADFDGAI